MKISILLVTCLLLYLSIFSQNLGIRKSTPPEKINGSPHTIVPVIPTAENPSDFLIKPKPGEQTGFRKGHLGLGINYIIALDGAYPGQGAPQVQGPMIGEIKMFAGINPPYGWAFCQGQLLLTKDYPTLFIVIGTIYGGDGKNNFSLPDLRSAVPVGEGAGWLIGERSN